MNGINRWLITGGLVIYAIGIYVILFQGDWNLAWKFGMIGGFVHILGNTKWHWRIGR